MKIRLRKRDPFHPEDDSKSTIVECDLSKNSTRYAGGRSICSLRAKSKLDKIIVLPKEGYSEFDHIMILMLEEVGDDKTPPLYNEMEWTKWKTATYDG
jgi:hypothetical protein